MPTPVPSRMLPVDGDSCDRTDAGTLKVRASPLAVQMNVDVSKIGFCVVPPPRTPELPMMVMMSVASPPVQLTVSPLERITVLKEA